MATQEAIRTFAITLRPRGGILDEQVDTLVKYIKKQCDYYYIITEKTGIERHIHAGIFLKKKKTKSNFTTDILRLYKDLDPEEKSVMRKGIRVMFNADFLGEYMEKDDDTVVLEKNLPEASTMDSYFAEVPLPKKKGPQATDTFYDNLEKLWYEYKRPIDEPTPKNLRNFLMRMMNYERKIRVIADNRKIFYISNALARYISRQDYWDNQDWNQVDQYE